MARPFGPAHGPGPMVRPFGPAHGPWALGPMGPWAHGTMGPWALGPWALGPWALYLGPWALGPWALYLGVPGPYYMAYWWPIGGLLVHHGTQTRNAWHLRYMKMELRTTEVLALPQGLQSGTQCMDLCISTTRMAQSTSY